MSKKRSASITESSSKSKPSKIKKVKEILPSSATLTKRHSTAASDEHQPKSRRKESVSTLPSAEITSHSTQINFPRGGGISITPYQQAEAKRDGVQQAEQLVKSFDSTRPKPHSARRSLSGSRTKPNKNSVKQVDDRSTESYRIEHLNSKRLIPGIKLAGIIIQIRPLALIVALPSHLVAHVPISEVSCFYTRRLEETAEEEELKSQSSSDHSQQSESSLKGLNQIFSVGQWIRCSMLKISSNETTKDHRLAPLVRAAMKVTLTLDPVHVNSGIDKSNLHSGMTLTGAVRSIEDRGYIVDFGIPLDPNVTPQTSSNNMTAFISFSDATQSTELNHDEHPSSQWEIGQVVWCRINKLSENGATCVVSVSPRDLSRSVLTAALNINSILPLHMVPCQVSAIIPSRGLNVNFLGFFKGTIDLSHLGLDGTNESALEEKFQVGQKLSARVLWDTIPSKNHTSLDEHESMLGPKIFSLTLLDHIIKQDPSGLPSELLHQKDLLKSCDRIDQIVRYPVGYTFQTVRINRVEGEWGVYVTCIDKVDGHPIEETMGKRPIGFVHISAITDSFLPTLSPTSGPYKIGSTHKARVTGISPVDGCLQLSLQSSVIERTFMCPEDIPAGARIDVTVKRFTSSLLVVQIHDGLEGIVWPDHYSDVTLRQPEKRFLLGAKLKARVLYTNSDKNQVVMTLRRSLLDLDAEIITSYESARVGLITYGLVKTVRKSNMSIIFFGRTQGVVSINHADQNFSKAMTGLFSPGQLIKVRIINVDVQRRRIHASCKLDIADGVEKTPTSLEIGDHVSAFVTGVGANSIKLDLYQSGAGPSTSHPARALISLQLLASKQGISPDDLKSKIKKGDEINDMVVTGQDKIKNLWIVGFPPSPFRKSRSISKQASLGVGEEVAGIIKFIHEKCLVLHLVKDDQESVTEAPVEAFLSTASLAQKRQVSIDELKIHSLIGQKIRGLQLTYKNEERGLWVVGFPDLQLNEPSLAMNLAHSEPHTLSTSDRVIGRICGISETNIELHLRREGTEGYADAKGIISIEKVAKYRHISQGDLRSAIKLGDYINELIVREKTERNGLYLLRFSSSESNRHSAMVTPQALTSQNVSLSIGDSVVGTVQAIHEKNVVFSLKKDGYEGEEGSSFPRGIMLSKVLAGHWHTDVENLKDKLKEGLIIRKLVVKKIDPSRDLMIVGFAPTAAHLPLPSDEIYLGMILEVCITGRNTQGLRVTPVAISRAQWNFTIDFTDITDDYDEKISHGKGSTISAVVIRIDNSSAMVYLSSRQSDLDKCNGQSPTTSVKDPPIRSVKISREDPVRGFVQKISPKVGLILQVGTGIRATVRVKELGSDWKTNFRIGQVVRGRITSSTPSKLLYMTLLERPDWSDLQVGQTFMAHVSKVGPHGLFLRLPSTRIFGLCHSSQVYDDPTDFKKKFEEDRENEKFTKGMKLKASICSIDAESKKIAFTIKPSVVEAQPVNKLTDPQDLVVKASGDQMDQSAQQDSDESTDDEPSDSQLEKQFSQPPAVSVDFTKPSLPLSTGFLWGNDQSKQPNETVISDEESTCGTHLSRRRVSDPLINGNLAEKKSVDELEKCLLESPNSSQLWIRLILLYVQKADITKARETAKRALEAIHYREETEKWKVWVCLLNLENTYGTEEQFSATFSEASARNDSKTVWLKVAEIYSQSGKLEKAEQTYTQVVQRFRHSCKAWCLFGAFCLQYNRPHLYTDLLSRSLKSLPKMKHIKTITKFAQLEFRLGDPERGRTLFEGLVGTYPKRTDLWIVYIDLEMKSETTAERIRSLFSRMMGLKLNPKKTKSILKKWYNYEKSHGDQESQNMVIAKAQSFVTSLTSNSQEPNIKSLSSKDHVNHNQIDDVDDDTEEL